MIALQATWVDPAQGLSGYNNTIYPQAMTIGQVSMDNVSLASISSVSITGFDGRERQPALGTLALGVDSSQVQTFSRSDQYKIDPITAYLYSGGLFNRSLIGSYSFGLHIGSASLNYAGSLLFGGYDRARIIGPFTTYTDPPRLYNIQIGVETGGSPFAFEKQNNLLKSNASKTEAIQVIIDPGTPYLSLPSQTCEAIAQYLPVYFDEGLKYYLWNKTYPGLDTMLSSAAYLGFEFPPASGKTENVLIKVPLTLLNLTLEPPIVPSKTPYFPCVPFTPQGNDNYRLGRAFLQASFVGRNFNKQRSWLAQAPGPGAQDSGTDLQEIHDADLTLDVISDATLFATTWEHHWTPLPSRDSNSVALSSGNLSTGAKAGIAVGAVVATMALVAAVLLCFRHRKTASSSTNEPLISELDGHPQHHSGATYELEGINTDKTPIPKPVLGETHEMEEAGATKSPLQKPPSPRELQA